MELSSFPIIQVNEIDITKYQTVITAPMNGDYKEHMIGNLAHWQETGEITGGQLKQQKDSGLPRLSHLIIWNLERPSGDGTRIVPNYALEAKSWIDNRFADEVWVSDAALAEETMLRYVILGSDYGLGELSEHKQYDFTHMSVPIPRRVQIYKDFGISQIGPNCWPWNEKPNRNEVLKLSRFALNVHQDNFPFCEPLRMALFAAYGLPIISETLKSGFPYGSDIMQASYHELVDKLKEMMASDYGEWQKMGMKLRKKMCEDLQFGKMVRQAVNESTGTGWR